MTRVLRVFVSLLFVLTALTSVGQLYASPSGCCGSDDCGIVGEPFQACSPIGPNNETCQKVHPYLTYCCNLGGWCG
jgi:hypothetical protein